ncbi:MAG: sulfate ABC transporter substrate-binding protein [Propionicimonas sp.]
MSLPSTSRRKLLAGFLATATAVAVSACSNIPQDSASASGVTLDIVGFAVPAEANKRIGEAWNRTPAGAGVAFQTSYGASGDQSRNVASGQPADYVHFSLEGDVTRLVEAKLVDPSWNAGPNKGIVSKSVVVIAVRPGNPLGIKGWDDIVKPGVKIVTPNPSSSGAARWNILAAWAHVIGNGGSDADGEAFLRKLLDNTVALPGSGRDATTAFTGGTGDVFITYENEAILARQKQGDVFDYIVPGDTLLIENPGAVLTNANPKAKPWLNFVLSDAGQEIFAETGFRPLNGTVNAEVKGANDPENPFPQPQHLYTVGTDFGGWPATTEKFFTEGTGIIPKLLAQTGKA